MISRYPYLDDNPYYKYAPWSMQNSPRPKQEAEEPLHSTDSKQAFYHRKGEGGTSPLQDYEANENKHTQKDSLAQESRFIKQDYIDLFGIKLHFDDILILLILYFLYTEDVKDMYLFITLVLLLLT